MASISEIMYEETRSKDGTTFSKKLNVKVSLDQGEGTFDPRQPVPQLLGLSVNHVVEFVHGKLDEGVCPPFVTGDKVPPAPDAPKHPCAGCEHENRCPDVCAKWIEYVKAGGEGMPPKIVPKGEVKPPAPEAPRPQATGPAVGAKPFQPAAPRAEPPAGSLTIVRCTVCGTDCEKKISDKTGKPYHRCPKCKDNRQRNGAPFPEA